MPYPNGYLYLTAHWVVTGSLEGGQFGLKFDTPAPATQLLVNAAAGRLSTFWTAATSVIPNTANLQYARLAAIGPDGLYVPGTTSFDFTYGGGVVGSGGVAGALFPLQIAHVMTLRTALPRGRGHVGRVYLPPIQAVIQADWKWQAAQVNTRNLTFAQMCTNLNLDLPGPLTVFSRLGAGTKHVVTQINADNKPDTQRRRALSQPGVLGIPANV